MNNVIKPGPTQLPAELARKLMTGIAESRASTIIAGGGKPLLRLLKSGNWVYGMENEEVQAGSHWVVNVMSLAHGWACWVEGVGNAKNELRGEIMVSMADPKPLRPAPISATDFNEQRSFELKCIDGTDAGAEVLYKTTSVGGMREVDGLLAKVQVALASHPEHPCPVLTLDVDSYQHTKWGQISTPVFSVETWSTMDGKLLGEAAEALEASAPAPAPAEPARPARVRKAPLGAAGPAQVSPPREPVPTPQTHVGQRRRPAAS